MKGVLFQAELCEYWMFHSYISVISFIFIQRSNTNLDQNNNQRLPIDNLKAMGNQPHFCCDHNAELRLFESHQRILTENQPNPARNIPAPSQPAPPAKNKPLQRIFSKDDVSIIDQLDLKSEIVKEDLFLPPSDKTLRATLDQENTRSFTREYSSVVDRKWEQHKLQELQFEKRRQTEIIRKELERQYRARHSLKEKKKENKARSTLQRPSTSRDPRKQCDFQFIVNYR